MEKFAERLKQLRLSRGLTLGEISRGTGIPNQTLSRYEQNKRDPIITYAKKLADYFSVDMMWLCGFKD